MRSDGDGVKKVTGGLMVIVLTAGAGHELVTATLHGDGVREVTFTAAAVDWMPAEGEHSNERELGGDWRRVRRAVSSTSTDMVTALKGVWS